MLIAIMLYALPDANRSAGVRKIARMKPPCVVVTKIQSPEEMFTAEGCVLRPLCVKGNSPDSRNVRKVDKKASLCKAIPLLGEMSAQRTKGFLPAEQGR